MPDTPRALDYLTGTSFASGQSAGISSDDLRDFAVSVPLWDDPANTSGLGAPAILRGTVSTYSLAGTTGGSGLSTEARTANATALQNAINYAAANAKWFEFHDKGYEIYSSTGLVVPYTSWSGHGFHWRGWGGSVTQFYTNAPGLVFGDPTAANICNGFDIEGCWAAFGSDQTGQTNASGIVIGPMWLSKFSQFGADAGGGYQPYIGINVVGSGTFFSNRLSDIYVNGCQKTYLNIHNMSTQNVWERVHLTGGSGPATISGPALNLDMGGGAGEGSTFEGLNIEHCSPAGSSALVNLSGARQLNLHNVHFENTGGTWALISCVDSSLNVSGMDVYDCRFLSGDGYAGTTYIFYMFYYNTLRVDVNSLLIQFTQGSKVNQPIQIFGIGTSSDETPPHFTMRGFHASDFAGNSLSTYLSMDPNLNVTDYPGGPSSVDLYRYGSLYSFIEGARYNLGDQDFTHYGQSKHAYLWFPAALSTTRTLTLSNNMRSSSPGATVPRMVGDTVTVYRGSGSATNNLLIKNGAGTTLTTSSTAGLIYYYVYNGTNFVAVT